MKGESNDAIKMGPKLSADKSESQTKLEIPEINQATEIDNNKSTLVKYIRQAINTTPVKPTKSKFAFKTTHEAAKYNCNLIKENQFDIKKVLDQEKTSCTAPSYKF